MEVTPVVMAGHDVRSSDGEPDPILLQHRGARRPPLPAPVSMPITLPDRPRRICAVPMHHHNAEILLGPQERLADRHQVVLGLTRQGYCLARQAKDDLLTIRQPFLWTEQHLELWWCMGTAPIRHRWSRRIRIGLDTGAGNGGKLTCAVLEEDRVGFLAA